MLLIALAFLAVILFVAYHMVRFRNPYKLYMVFGKKRVRQDYPHDKAGPGLPEKRLESLL